MTDAGSLRCATHLLPKPSIVMPCAAVTGSVIVWISAPLASKLVSRVPLLVIHAVPAASKAMLLAVPVASSAALNVAVAGL